MSTPTDAPLAVAVSGNPFPAGEALPRAPVLAYLVTVSTPTRARKVAALGALAVGLGCLGLAMLIVGVTAWQIHGIALYLTAGVPTLAEYLKAAEVVEYSRFYSYLPSSRSLLSEYILGIGILGRVILTGLLLVPGLWLPLMVRAIRRGRSVTSRLAVVLIVPLIVLVFPVTVIPPCAGMVLGLGRNAEPMQLLWLLVLPPGVVLILLLKDLCAYLLWIGRNPMVEKPAVAFVPGQVGARL